jgi:SP family general alpha glucoside:H+ symporter-like MFS transporter
MCYSTIFFQQAGLPAIETFNLSMAQYALGAVGTFGSWFLMGKRVDVRSTYGFCIFFGLLMIIGLTSLAPSSNRASRWAIGSMLLLFTFIYKILKDMKGSA